MNPFLLALLLVLTACERRPDVAASGSAAPPAPVSQPAAGDHIDILARHNDRELAADREGDPVVMHVDRYQVTRAQFDPAHLEGGTATLELDFTSLRSNSVQRDEDLMAPEWLDTARFATCTIEVADVKAQGGRYIAAATVDFHGTRRTYPVTFDVMSSTASSVRIKGEHAFSRLDFSIGSDPAKDFEQRVDTLVTIEFVLTLTTS